MKNLHITEPRCAGTDHKVVPTICPQRDSCQRHKQIELDRQLGLPPTIQFTVLSLPRVGRHDCHYHRVSA
jgi:hypothetical protein